MPSSTHSAAAFDKIYTHLLTHVRPPLLHTSHPFSKALTPEIADLRVHPTLESALHLLNHDLPSAHFLLRQDEALREGQLLHGILHRLEGDYVNALCWYRDASSAPIMERVWGPGGKQGLEDGKAWKFVKDIERLDGRVQRGEKSGEIQEEIQRLEGESRGELERVVGWCRDVWGTDVVEDARFTGACYGRKDQEGKKGLQDLVTGAGRKFEGYVG